MQKPHKTDEELIRLLRGTEPERDEALKYIYVYSGWRQAAKSLVLSAGGAVPDAEDAVHDAIIRLDNHVRNFNYRYEGSLRSFFIGICRWRWYSARRSVKRLDNTDDLLKLDGVETFDPAVLMLAGEQKAIVDEVLNLLDTVCREVLMLYKLSYSMEEIARELDLKNPNNAKQKVHHCRENLRKLGNNHPVLSEYLKAEA